MTLPVFVQDHDQPTTCPTCGSACGMEFITQERERLPTTTWFVYRRCTVAIHVAASSEEEAIVAAQDSDWADEDEIDAQWSAEPAPS